MAVKRALKSSTHFFSSRLGPIREIKTQTLTKARLFSNSNTTVEIEQASEPRVNRQFWRLDYDQGKI